MPCGHSRGNIPCSTDLKIGQNVCLDESSNDFEFGSPWVKNLVSRSCGLPKGHICCSVDLKISQNICIDNISDKFEFWSPGVTR